MRPVTHAGAPTWTPAIVGRRTGRAGGLLWIDLAGGPVTQVGFEPKIVALLCNWCTYSAADAAGSAHSPYPANIHIVRVMCSGRVDPAIVLRCLRDGADGVLVCGCHLGDCHYVDGNHKTAFRLPLLQRMLADLGLEPERLRLEWISATEAQRFVSVAHEMTEQVRALGPLRWRGAETAATSASGSGAA